MTTAYDAIADGYDAAVAGDRWMRRALWSIYRERLAGRILDLGCGTGIDAVSLARQGMTVDGIDSSTAMINRALARAEHAGVTDRTTFRVADIATVDGPGTGYDGAISAFGALNTVANRATVAERLARLLRPGGVAVLHFVNQRSLWEAVGGFAHGRQPTFPASRMFAIGGQAVDHWLSLPIDEARTFAPSFRLLRVGGYGSLRPPHTLRRLPPGIVRLAGRIERPLRSQPPLRDWGRFFVLELARR